MENWKITGRTRVWIHVSHPSAPVLSTGLLNKTFRERELDVVAVSVDVAPEDMPALIRGLKGWRNLVGIGVTMPHKERIVAVCDEVVGLAKQMKAVNAIRREPDGRLIGANTDGSGFVNGLRRAGYDPAGKRVLLVGAGGASAAIAFALAEAGVGAQVVANRTVAKAERIAERVTEAFPNISTVVGPPDPTGFDWVVNTTPLGMREGDPLPLDVSLLTPEMVVIEVIVTPARTPLLEEAERRGCRTQPGMPMLTGQIDDVLAFLRLDQPAAPTQ
jgi:shikimate dehydrogenase